MKTETGRKSPPLRIAGVLSITFFLCAAALPAMAHTGDLAECVPADAMMYASWDFSKDVEANYRKSALHKFLQEEEVIKFMERAMEKADILEPGDREAPVSREEAWKLAHSRLALWISDIETKKVKVTDEESGEYEYEEEIVTGGIIAEFLTDDAKKAARKIIKFAQEEAAKEENITRQIVDYKKVKIKHYKSEDGGDFKEACFFEIDGKYVVTSSLSEAKKIIRLMKGEEVESLARSRLYKKTLENLSRDRVITGFMNLEAIFKKYEKEMFEDEMGKRAFEFIRLGDAKAVGLGGVAAESRLALELYVYTPATNSPLFQLFRNGRARFNCMELVKRDALTAIAGTINPLDCWGFYKQSARLFDEDSYKESMDALKEFEKESKLSLDKDLLANIGTEAVVIIPDAAIDLTSGVPLGVVLAVQIKDRDRVEKFIRAAIAHGGGEMEEAPYRGYKILGSGESVFFCFTRKYWLIGSSDTAIKEVIKTLKGDRPLLVNSEKYRRARRKIEGDITAVGYINLARFFEMVNSLVKNLAQRDFGAPFDEESREHGEKNAQPTLFPVDLLKKYFPSVLAGLKVDNDGMLLKALAP